MTSPHPQREEAARLWPEYNSAESQPFRDTTFGFCTIFLAGASTGVWLVVVLNFLHWVFGQ